MSPERVVAATRQWLGTPYRHQGATLGAGCDCLGLLRGVWRSLYGGEPMAMPPYRADIRDHEHADTLSAAARALLVENIGPLAAGQVVLFKLNAAPHPKHCGILLNATRFIHAQERLGVIEANLTAGWAKRVAARFDFPSID
ncbi:NlpC/P60 family protein [Devosia rhodophyticola]|uniref:NlpC/P60 family protein n=1 Tax=Devosia rhodophyticola TaxID=3026423 RepID=A0ABY7YYC4_9HYPH|nr:NlpC/P60 family protein [Devosia rhodophyticola]WDR06393.1 NlpC/P60 family protein [Devosia rhodophyticola]